MACTVGDEALEQIDHAGSNALRIVFAGSSALVSDSLRVSGGRLKKNIRLIHRGIGPRCQLQEEGSQGDQGDPRLR